MADRTRTHRGTNYVVSAAHPAAEAFPWLDDDEIQAMADDIKENGQEYKVLRLPDGRVVDGRNRELACRVAGVEPDYAEEDLTDEEVVGLVISRNLHRRSLTASQRAMIAAELANMRRGRPTEKTGTGAGLLSKPHENKVSQSEAAQAMDVSERSVRSAAKVKDKAPELAERVKEGDLDVTTAAKVAKLPAKERKRVAKAKDPKKAAREALAKPRLCEPEGEEAEKPDHGAEFVATVETLCRDMDQIGVRLEALKASPFSYSIHVDSAASQVKAARQTLWQGRPAHTCPYCKGEGCKTCHTTGRVKRSTFDSGTKAVGEAA
jgi:hypothetical protein